MFTHSQELSDSSIIVYNKRLNDSGSSIPFTTISGLSPAVYKAMDPVLNIRSTSDWWTFTVRIDGIDTCEATLEKTPRLCITVLSVTTTRLQRFETYQNNRATAPMISGMVSSQNIKVIGEDRNMRGDVSYRILARPLLWRVFMRQLACSYKNWGPLYASSLLSHYTPRIPAGVTEIAGLFRQEQFEASLSSQVRLP